ncbi:MAG: chalcone isomerase family protein [Terrimicrobiaceae bacterium]
MKRFAWILCLLVGVPLMPLHALQIEGVEIPPQVTVDGTVLNLNGAGLRTVVLLIVPIKAYVAAFYSPTPLRSASAVQASPGPLRFDFTFLQAVSQGQVAQAWQAQFRDSATFQYPNLTKDVATFSQFFGPIRSLGVQSVELSGTTTRILENGKLKGTISGTDFQKAFLSLWFGSNPVMPSLKTALLRGSAN